MLAYGRAVEIGDAARQRGKAEAIHHQMMIALIPKPMLIVETEQAVMPQLCAAQYAQIAIHVVTHQRARFGGRIGLRAQIDNLRQAKGVWLRPLQRFAFHLTKGHIQRVGFLHARNDRLRQQGAINLTAQFDKVRHRVSVVVR